jgi:hypothetical protein
MYLRQNHLQLERRLCFSLQCLQFLFDAVTLLFDKLQPTDLNRHKALSGE